MVRSVQATESRDQIYALFDLKNGAYHNGESKSVLLPDYCRSQFDVFEDVVCYCIRKSNGLAILGAGGTDVDQATDTTDIRHSPPS